MNTSKQVNAMIGLLFLSLLVFGALAFWEGSRIEDEREAQADLLAERGAELFVNNCRNCHGLTGRGFEEGGVAPALRIPGYLILEEDNEFGAPETPVGIAQEIRNYLTMTIACGRTNTFMPTWSQEFGGPLQDVQVDYLVEMITQGRWDLVEEIGHEHDEETGQTPEEILVQDPSTLSVTRNNCGQYAPEEIQEIRNRDPFDQGPAAPPADGTAAPDGTATPDGTQPPAAGEGQPVALGEFFVEAPESVSAGDVTFDVTNEGAIPHELVVIRSDEAPDALPVAAGAVDESQVEVVDRTAQFAGGESTTLTVDLESGNYVLICNIPGHYQGGMRAGLTVE